MEDIEFEGKILHIDPASMMATLSRLGAIFQGKLHFERYIFDTIPRKDGRWVRLRSDGRHTTLTVKEISSESISGTKEWEVEVSNLKITLELLSKIGLKHRNHQENLRFAYTLDDCELCIDIWPHIDPYLEIESSSKDKVLAMALRLGFTEDQVCGENTEKLYKKIGLDITRIQELAFGDAELQQYQTLAVGQIIE